MILVCDICASDSLNLYLLLFLNEVVLIVLIPIFHVLNGIWKLEFLFFSLLWIIKKHMHLPIVVFPGKICSYRQNRPNFSSISDVYLVEGVGYSV